MTLQEATYWRDLYFQSWIGRYFPETGAYVRAVRIVPEDPRYQDDYFRYLDEATDFDRILGLDGHPDDEALGRIRQWKPDDAFFLLFEMMYTGGEHCFQMPASEFLHREGICIEPVRLFAA